MQLREQDFGNFQDPEGKKREKAERLRFGRFFYRFPNGESGADCYDRITGFQGEGKGVSLLLLPASYACYFGQERSIC